MDHWKIDMLFRRLSCVDHEPVVQSDLEHAVENGIAESDHESFHVSNIV